MRVPRSGENEVPGMPLRNKNLITTGLMFAVLAVVYGWRTGGGAANVWIVLAALCALTVMRQIYVAEIPPRAVHSDVDRRELWLIRVVSVGTYLMPAILFATPLLDGFDYRQPVAATVIGLVVLLAAMVLFWRSHADLGRFWSASLEIRRGHQLVTTGVYARIRHPMYAALWMYMLAQALLLANFVAGPAGLVGFGLLYLMRIEREEAMLAKIFGADWTAYTERTGRIVPRLRPS
jgi:protein-S-isoprenylcysteine O-methyltransferase Ste14